MLRVSVKRFPMYKLVTTIHYKAVVGISVSAKGGVYSKHSINA